jgi:SAM-dependent methyltransferase/uncharacterized protein YbaR (Trm112 family)
MLPEIVEKLLCPVCRVDATLQLIRFTDGEAGHVREGVLGCSECEAWYRIEDEILEFVAPSLADHVARQRFRERHASTLVARGLEARDPAISDADISAQLKQRQHFDWFADNPCQDYTAYQQTPFWVAADRSVYKAWLAEVTPGGWILDVGCADGRSAFPFAEVNVNVVGFDVSSKMVAKATHRAKEMGLHGRTTFLTADGSATFPFRESSLDHVVIYGVLHHLPDPGGAYREAIRVLKPGGVYFGSENNRSAFRGLFELMMKIKRLWVEEAGPQPLISVRDLQAWNKTQPAVLTYRSSVFLPPHFYNIVGHRLAGPCLDLTDRLSRFVPWYGRQGGLIIFEARKESFP